MQKKVIFLSSFFLILVLTPCISNATSSPILIKQKADSLFDSKKYTEALDLYLALHTSHNVTSDDNLLKLALSYEGLGDIPKALYYLEKYNTINHDEEILEHIQKLGENNNLMGYKLEDIDRFQLLFYNYKLPVSISLIGLIFIHVIVIGFKTFKNKKTTPFAVSFLILFTISITVLNLGTDIQKGIINKDCMLMDNASGSSTLKSKIEKGHKVLILEEKDIWYKVKLDDETYFIRKFNVDLI